MDCSKCNANCCKSVMFELFDKDHKRWVELHGIKIKKWKDKDYAFFPIKCKKLKGTKCSIYEDRPDLCRRYEC